MGLVSIISHFLTTSALRVFLQVSLHNLDQIHGTDHGLLWGEGSYAGVPGWTAGVSRSVPLLLLLLSSYGGHQQVRRRCRPSLNCEQRFGQVLLQQLILPVQQQPCLDDGGRAAAVGRAQYPVLRSVGPVDR